MLESVVMLLVCPCLSFMQPSSRQAATTNKQTKLIEICFNSTRLESSFLLFFSLISLFVVCSRHQNVLFLDMFLERENFKKLDINR